MLDYYRLSDQFTDEERQTQASVREFLDAEALPHISGWWERAEFPRQLVPRLAELGLIGANMPDEYGASGVGSLAYGLVMYELERIDSGLRSFASVQGALCMYPIPAVRLRATAAGEPAQDSARRDDRLLRTDRALRGLRSRRDGDPRRGGTGVTGTRTSSTASRYGSATAPSRTSPSSGRRTKRTVRFGDSSCRPTRRDSRPRRSSGR